ncbi:MAG: aminotransferase class V-fold PLP-dependent enzyme [Candidatus Portnoybacteria bacterium]|nr:aminotransferase class V-fold PLP-dependent enzyme [Candidatus Portnoybacteria bacterium]
MYFSHKQLNKFTLKPFFGKINKKEVLNKLERYFPNRSIVFTDSGRSAFKVGLRSLGLENSEILLPAYICNVLSPVLKKYGIKVKYMDADMKSFNMDIEEIEKNITPETKAIVVSHNYGLPGNLKEIKDIGKRYSLKIIEDCAHIFPLFSDAGKIGDCSFFSFSKICPIWNGGMLVSKKEVDIDLKKYSFDGWNIVKFFRLFPSIASFSEMFRSRKKELPFPSYSIPRDISKTSLRVFNSCLDGFRERYERRILLAGVFQKKLKELGFSVQEGKDNMFTFLSALVPDRIDRDILFDNLRKEGICCFRMWHRPIIVDEDEYPISFYLSKNILNFPLQDWYKESDIDDMVKKIDSALKGMR